MESGHVYVRVKMYPQALYRFRQAEEVSKAIPEPNKEIGLVRVLQVKERVARGESPTSTAILDLLDEAVQNFSAALAKAENLGPLHGEDERPRNAEAVSNIAGEMLKLNLASTLGKRHPKVRELGALARDSFKRVAGDQVADLAPEQLLFLGLAAMDEGDFAGAEEHFFKAAESRDHFSKACVEINYLGTVLRKRAGAKEAIEVYERLLHLDPPNRAAVNFNVSVAYVVEKRELDGAAAIVRAVFADPELPRNELFYKNTQIYETLRSVVSLFGKAARASAKAAPQDVIKARQIQDRLERSLSSKNDAEAFRLVALISAKMPDFFQREHVLASKRIMRYVRAKAQELAASQKPDMVRLADILAKAGDKDKARAVPKRLIAHTDFRRQAREMLEAGEERAKAAGFLAKALICHPEYVDAPELYTDLELNTLMRDTAEHLKNVDMDKIDHFYKLYGLDHGAKAGKPRAVPSRA